MFGVLVGVKVSKEICGMSRKLKLSTVRLLVMSDFQIETKMQLQNESITFYVHVFGCYCTLLYCTVLYELLVIVKQLVYNIMMYK